MQPSGQCTESTEAVFGREMHDLMRVPFLLVLIFGVNVIGDVAI